MDEDGIQVDKIVPIGYNIPHRANAMIRSPTLSPFPYDIDRDNFLPSFVALGATGDVSLLFGVSMGEG